MQWDSSENAGFSSAPAEKLYIPLDPDPDRPTAEKQIAVNNSLRSEVKKLIAVRQAHKALQSLGDIEFVCDGAKGRPLAYVRSFDGERILVAVNPTDSACELTVGGSPWRGYIQLRERCRDKRQQLRYRSRLGSVCEA